jgi:polysaccharide transporter, PST family
MERMKYTTFINITSKVLFTALIFIFIRKSSDFMYVPLFNSIGFLVAGILSFWVVLKDFKVKLFLPKSKTIFMHMKDSSQFFLSRVSVSIYTSSNTFVIGMFLGNTLAGYYSAAEKLFYAFTMIYQPLNDALYPYMSKQRNLRLYKKLFTGVCSINLIIFVGVFLFSNTITSLLYGDGFAISAKLLKIFCVLGIINVPSILLGYPLLAAMGYPKYANSSVIISSLVHLILLILMIPVINIYYVASLLIVTQIIVIGVRIYGIKASGIWYNMIGKGKGCERS